jgi:16S rRNA (uracil1498-N3)-methyltransferase
MSMRAFTPERAEPLPGSTIELDDEESHYLVKVRRARIGDALELFDGRGGAWAASLRTTGRHASVEVGAPLCFAEPVPRVVLLGLPDQPATLEALTGASELGATHVVLVACDRSNARVPPAARVQRILRASQRQCGRPRPLEVIGGAEALALARALELRDELPGVFAWEALRDTASEPDVTERAGGLRLLVGPEGGLTPPEVEQLRAAGFRAVSLGPWVLRTPTAVIAMLARFQGF